MNNNSIPLTLAVLSICAATTSSFAQTGGGYDLTWSTLDGGGATSTGGGYELSGTIGQPDATVAGALGGSDFTLTGGFWGVAIPACTTFVGPDFDHDCDVDTADFSRFEACATGERLPYDPDNLPSGCSFTPTAGHIAPDFDSDGDVDAKDFAIFQRCISGENMPALAGCDS